MRNLQNNYKESKRPSLWKPYVLLFVSIIVIGLIITGTTPDSAGPLGITLLFMLIFATLISSGLIIRSTLLNKPSSVSLLLVVLFSVGAISLLALNTIELNRGDIVLVTLFVGMFSLYWVKLRQ